MNVRIACLTLTGTLLTFGALSCGNTASSTDPSAHTPTPETAAVQPHTNHDTDVAPAPRTQSEPAAVIPDFTFYILRSGIQFTRSDLAQKGNRVFILFDPTCSHCQHEASHLGTHYNEVKDANFYFVSMNDPALMSTFLETHAKELVGKPNVELLYDKNAEFINKFHIPSQYPAVYIYGANGQLKEYWDGERKIADVVAAIRR